MLAKLGTVMTTLLVINHESLRVAVSGHPAVLLQDEVA